VPDPAELIHYLPDGEGLRLRAPHALVAFGGWVDAGSGGTGGVRHLIGHLNTRKLAEIDPEEFYNFTDSRPLVSIVGPGERAIHWPRGEFHGATLEHTSDLVLFVAPEPNLRWKTFATIMLDGLQRFGVQSIVCIGSIFGAVPHRGEVRMTGWANDETLREGLARRNVMSTNYEGPTGFVTVLLAEASARGMPAVAVYGFAPNYIQGVPNPRVSHALLQTFSAITGVPLQLTDLDRAGRALARQVDRLLQDQPQLREQVERMLSLMNVVEPVVESDDEPESGSHPNEPPDANVELPSPQAVVNELEEFLKQLRRDDPSAPDGGGQGQ
jgi:proteasome assembly chaperone (PAC2) family protein